MQKFTRSLTREIEIGGQRIVVTVGATGIQLRRLGSRRPPVELSWASCLCHAVLSPTQEPGADMVARALAALADGDTCSREAPPAPQALMTTAPAGDTLPPLDELLERLDAWLTENRPRFRRALQPGATGAEIEALRQSLPCPTPPELVLLLRWHNGQSPDVFGALEENWILMSTGDILDVKEKLDADRPAGWQLGWVPFLDNDGGSYLCLDTTELTPPVVAYWDGAEEHPVVAPSLQAWVGDFLAAIERGEYYEDPERGGFHRRD